MGSGEEVWDGRKGGDGNRDSYVKLEKTAEKQKKNNLKKRYKGVKNWLKQKLEISQGYELHIILNMKRAVFIQ